MIEPVYREFAKRRHALSVPVVTSRALDFTATGKPRRAQWMHEISEQAFPNLDADELEQATATARRAPSARVRPRVL